MLDPYWQAAVDELQVRPEVVTAGPVEMKPFVPGLLSFTEIRVVPERIVCHKGMVNSLPIGLFAACVGRARVVFANEVFVIFEVGESTDPHVRALEIELARQLVEPSSPPGPILDRQQSAPRVDADPATTELQTRIATANWALGALPSTSFQGSYLDVGFGSGNALIAAALKGCPEVHGIDIDFQQRSQAGGEHAPAFAKFAETLAETGLSPDRFTLIDGDICYHDFGDKRFDLISLLDVIEHVREPGLCISRCAKLLKPNGRLLIAGGGMYYSQVGHHLWHWWPVDSQPWRHLYHDFEPQEREGIRKRDGVTDWYWNEFRRLNRVTVSQIRQYCDAAGLAEESYQPLYGGGDKVHRVAQLIDMKQVPSLEDLFLEGLVLVCFDRDTNQIQAGRSG